MKKQKREKAVNTGEDIVEAEATITLEATKATEVEKPKRGRKPKTTESTTAAGTTEAEAEKTGRRGKPVMTWTQRGFLFNGEAIQLIGAPEYVIFELDETARRLIVKDAGDTKPRFSFATSEKRSKTAFITANKFREAIGRLLDRQPESGGIHFTFTAIENGTVGIADLTT